MSSTAPSVLIGAPVAARRAASAASRRRRLVSHVGGYLFLLPYLVLFTAFLLYPLVYGVWLSAMEYELLSPEPPRFIGLGNYAEAMGDPYFWNAMRATALFTVLVVPLTVVLALALAAGLNALPPRREHLYRLCIFVPTMITISVAGLVWRWFYNGEFGLFNAILGEVGIKVPWVTDPDWAMPSIVLMTLWWTMGVPVVILAAGLKQVPRSVLEAAEIDGATGLRRFVAVTLPLIRPVLLFVAVIQLIGAFQVFGQTFIITRGGPEQSTRVLVQYIYETAFNMYRLGYGAAMSWLLFLVIAGVTFIQFRVLRER